MLADSEALICLLIPDADADSEADVLADSEALVDALFDSRGAWWAASSRRQ